MCEKSLQLRLINDNLFAPSCKHSVIYIYSIQKSTAGIPLLLCPLNQNWRKTETVLQGLARHTVAMVTSINWLFPSSVHPQRNCGRKKGKKATGRSRGEEKKTEHRERDGDGDKQEGWFSNKKKRAVKTCEMKVCGLATAKVTMLNTVGVRDPLHCEVSSSSLTALQVYWYQ